MFRIGRSTETECRLVVARSWGKGGMEWLLNVMGFRSGVIKMSGNEMRWLHNTVTIQKKKKNHLTVHFKMTTMVNFTVFKFYLNLKEKVEERACCRLEWELMSNKFLWTLITSVFTVEDYSSMVKYIWWLLQKKLISSNEIQVT